MKSGPQLLLAALIVALGGCAALMPPRPADRDASLRLDRGLAAFDADRYDEAQENLTWVYRHCPSQEAGARALLALAALELDPRNPDASPAKGTELLGRALRSPGTPGWSRPLAETGFLVSLALGAPHPDHAPAGERPAAVPAAADSAAVDSVAAVEIEPGAEPGPWTAVAAELPEPLDPDEVADVYGCGSVIDGTTWTTPTLPTLPGPSMAAMLSEMQAQRDSIAVSADTLREELNAARGQLAATREELERIRRTLKP